MGKLHVMYACNEAYVPQLGASMLSLLENNQNLGHLHLHCVEDRFRPKTKGWIRRIAKRYGKQVTFYPLGAVIDGLVLRGGDRHPAAIYSKLCMDFLDIDRLLYLDCDTVVNGSLQYLENLELGHWLAAGVAMPYSSAQKKAAGLRRTDAYICDGVVLFHMRLWKKEQKSRQAAAYIRQWDGRPPMLSEGVLNYICRGRIRRLPPEYNLMPSMIAFRGKIAQVYGVSDYYTPQALLHAREHPRIIHYLEELYGRPWYKDSDHPYRRLYGIYAGMAGYPPAQSKEGLCLGRRCTCFCARYLPARAFVRLRKIKAGFKKWTDGKKQMYC